MSIPNLPTNFKDDILASSNTKRKYQQTFNSDGSVSLEDVTQYQQKGSDFGAQQVNQTNVAINNIYDERILTPEEAALVTEPGFFVDAQVIAELISKLTQTQTTTIKADYFSIPFTLTRKGNIVTIDINAAKQVHSWSAGTTQIYPTTPSGFAPASTARLPLYKDRSVIGYLSIATKTGIYINSVSAVNDGNASFTSSGCYMAE